MGCFHEIKIVGCRKPIGLKDTVVDVTEKRQRKESEEEHVPWSLTQECTKGMWGN